MRYKVNIVGSNLELTDVNGSVIPTCRLNHSDEKKLERQQIQTKLITFFVAATSSTGGIIANRSMLHDLLNKFAKENEGSVIFTEDWLLRTDADLNGGKRPKISLNQIPNGCVLILEVGMGDDYTIHLNLLPNGLFAIRVYWKKKIARRSHKDPTKTIWRDGYVSF